MPLTGLESSVQGMLIVSHYNSLSPLNFYFSFCACTRSLAITLVFCKKIKIKIIIIVTYRIRTTDIYKYIKKTQFDSLV